MSDIKDIIAQNLPDNGKGAITAKALRATLDAMVDESTEAVANTPKFKGVATADTVPNKEANEMWLVTDAEVLRTVFGLNYTFQEGEVGVFVAVNDAEKKEVSKWNRMSFADFADHLDDVPLEALVVEPGDALIMNGALGKDLDQVNNYIQAEYYDADSDSIVGDYEVNAFRFTSDNGVRMRTPDGLYVGYEGTGNGLKVQADELLLTIDSSRGIQGSGSFLRFNNTKNQTRFRFYALGHLAPISIFVKDGTVIVGGDDWKIANTLKIEDGRISTGQLKNGAVTSTKIADGAVGVGKLSETVIDKFNALFARYNFKGRWSADQEPDPNANELWLVTSAYKKNIAQILDEVFDNDTFYDMFDDQQNIMGVLVFYEGDHWEWRAIQYPTQSVGTATLYDGAVTREKLAEDICPSAIIIYPEEDNPLKYAYCKYADGTKGDPIYDYGGLEPIIEGRAQRGLRLFVQVDDLTLSEVVSTHSEEGIDYLTYIVGSTIRQMDDDNRDDDE